MIGGIMLAALVAKPKRASGATRPANTGELKKPPLENAELWWAAACDAYDKGKRTPQAIAKHMAIFHYPTTPDDFWPAPAGATLSHQFAWNTYIQFATDNLNEIASVCTQG